MSLYVTCGGEAQASNFGPTQHGLLGAALNINTCLRGACKYLIHVEMRPSHCWRRTEWRIFSMRCFIISIYIAFWYRHLSDKYFFILQMLHSGQQNFLFIMLRLETFKRYPLLLFLHLAVLVFKCIVVFIHLDQLFTKKSLLSLIWSKQTSLCPFWKWIFEKEKTLYWVPHNN